MYQLLFRNWKLALVWALAVSASVGAFFAEGGRHEQLEADVEKIRAGRSHAAAPVAAAAEPEAGQAVPAPVQAAGGEDAEAEAGDVEDAGWGQPEGEPQG